MDANKKICGMGLWYEKFSFLILFLFLLSFKKLMMDRRSEFAELNMIFKWQRFSVHLFATWNFLLLDYGINFMISQEEMMKEKFGISSISRDLTEVRKRQCYNFLMPGVFCNIVVVISLVTPFLFKNLWPFTSVNQTSGTINLSIAQRADLVIALSYYSLVNFELG